MRDSDGVRGSGREARCQASSEATIDGEPHARQFLAASGAFARAERWTRNLRASGFSEIVMTN